MSRNINVNPAHYKVKGRERQGEDVLHAMQKQAFSQQAEGERWQQQHQPMAPPHPPEQIAAEQAVSEVPSARRSAPRRKAATRKPAKSTRRPSAGRKVQRSGAKRTAAKRSGAKRPIARARATSKRKAPARRRR